MPPAPPRRAPCAFYFGQLQPERCSAALCLVCTESPASPRRRRITGLSMTSSISDGGDNPLSGGGQRGSESAFPDHRTLHDPDQPLSRYIRVRCPRAPIMRSYFAAAAVLLACVAAQDSHDSHDSHDETHDSHEEEGGHDSHEGEGGHFEAAAVYDVTAGTNTFVVVPAEGSFDDETFAFMIVPAPTADMEGLEVAEEEAETGSSKLRVCTLLLPTLTPRVILPKKIHIVQFLYPPACPCKMHRAQ